MKSLFITIALLSSGFAFAEQQKEAVSKIDGQLVKVGEHNKYDYSYKKWNVGVNAFLLPAGFVSASGSYAFHDNFAARLGFILDTNDYKSMSTDKNASAVNVGVPIYFKKVYDGFFVEPGYDSHSGLYAAGGYHWMWDSGLNIYAGAGLARKGGVGMLQVAYAFDTPRF